ncbi:MAG: UvrABC system protein B [Candidatus Moranbacteria bacterium GW2011_GWA2_39_41]|nr:MAG: UvrABC system protein B [Candidatus Moranbacteria bacterium GW2011_GWA2_39_41]
MRFKINSKYKPAGDQPQAIEKLVAGLQAGQKFQTLLGVTGSGKTFTIANVIEQVQKPTLVIAPNKTLAAQLAQEFRTFFPKNAVEYFVSYYDYYQPEAYIASSDTYIEKESQINEEIDRLRHASTAALLSRRDVIIVASVSCIYGLGSPEYYRDIAMEIKVGQNISREEISKELIEMQYLRTDMLGRSKFRMTGETVEIMSPAREVVTRIELGMIDETPVKSGKAGVPRAQFHGVKKIFEYDFLTGAELGKLEQVMIFPAKHFVVPKPIMQEAQSSIEKDLEKQVALLKKAGKLLEAERLLRRTRQDIEMMREIGYCNGIENYSRYLTGRNAGEAPDTLIDYFPKDFLMVVDESHVTIPQIGGMFNGDFSRKTALVDNGFRLPSAYDNRPLKFSEFESKLNQVIFTSATPSVYELEKSQITKNKSQTNSKSQITNYKQNIEFGNGVIEQIIRPTGLIDPEVIIKPAKGQVKDILPEIEKVVAKQERVLITTLTKKMAEDLSEFLKENGIKTDYLHSDVDTLDRIRILENLRRGEFDVLVGVNLLREGLDLPEVSLVAILDADKEGFLRSETSLIQTIGRAARNVSGRVILYADKITGSIKRAIDETNRRRAVQTAYNKKHHITPQTIKKNIESIVDHEIKPEFTRDFSELESLEDVQGYIRQKEKEMKVASKALQFEKAAVIRDEISQLRKLQLK